MVFDMDVSYKNSDEHDRQHGRVVNQVDDGVRTEPIKCRKHKLTQFIRGRRLHRLRHGFDVRISSAVAARRADW